MSPRQKRRTKIGEGFVTYKRSMVESPAFRVRSYAAMRVMHRIELEHMNHGGAENGRLIVTFDQFVKWGISRRFIAAAIRELVNLGFLEVTEQGYAGAAGNGKAARFRLTYVNCKSFEPPTDEWQRIDTIEIAEAIVSAAKREKNLRAQELGNRSWRAKMEKSQFTKVNRAQFTKVNQVAEISVHESEPLGPVHESEPLSRISGEAPEQTERPAKLPWSKPVVIDLGPLTPGQYEALSREPPADKPVNALAQATRVLH